MGFLTLHLSGLSRILRIENSMCVRGQSLTDAVKLETTVPKGSKSGSDTFTKYTCKLGDLIRELIILFNFFLINPQQNRKCYSQS